MDLSGYALNVLFCNGKTLAIYMFFFMKARCKPMQIIMAYTQVLISPKLQKVDLSGFANRLIKVLVSSFDFSFGEGCQTAKCMPSTGCTWCNTVLALHEVQKCTYTPRQRRSAVLLQSNCVRRTCSRSLHTIQWLSRTRLEPVLSELKLVGHRATYHHFWSAL